jgi:WhiB family redox-sensing transcriptional regulator
VTHGLRRVVSSYRVPRAAVRRAGRPGHHRAAGGLERGVDPALMECFSLPGTIFPMHIDTITPAEPTWQAQALCAQTGADFFFPEPGSSVREAKRICGMCEMRSACLEYALANDERFGIWGGLSEKERLHLRRTQQ